MRLNAESLALIKTSEGLKLKAYYDSAGVITVGFGNTSHAKPGQQISLEKAEEYLLEDLQTAMEGVKALVKVPLTDNQFGALTSFTYNVGIGNLAKSTLLKRLNVGDYNAAAEQFERWINAGGKPLKGLQVRRKAEKKLFLS